ncbi:VMAP-C domain-containing protein [Streptomyces sp. NBC_00582]|uniref:VMAP-C domain-containing protein n=1 Tax=Streptomyces sp. NBC_00582 TaxID=2975783 RepID=UPI002E803726|nr:hypothetical protein [Streptomyces sp. NBC_00582]WUB60336.1 hypothetical protein OG852_07990 [Streptomyces sp. NBC_00582]
MAEAGGLAGAERDEFVGAVVDELTRCRFLDEGTCRRTVGEHLGLSPELWEGTLPAFRVEVARHVSVDPLGRASTLCTVVGWYDEPRRESLWRRLQPFLTPPAATGANHHASRLPTTLAPPGPAPTGTADRNGLAHSSSAGAQAFPQLPSPFTADEHRRVQRLLMLERTGPREMHRLRDSIGFELGFPVPGDPTTPLDLFDALVDFNAPPDRIPPSVVAVEWVAAGITDETAARRCQEWAERWARDHDCLPALLRRRQARDLWQADPRVPRALLIMVEPAGDGSEDVTVRYWINDLAGHWAPRAGEATETRMDGLGAAVERALAEGERLWAASRADPADQLPPFVEFILPYLLLNHDVARLEIGSDGPAAAAIGPRYCVHLRSLDRLRRVSHDPFIANRWRQRWQELHQHGTRLHHWTHGEVPMDLWSRSLTHRQHGSAPYTALALDAPKRGSRALTALKRAIAEGFGLALWDRRGKLEPRSRETFAELLDGTRAAHGVPRRVQEMRARAEADADGEVFLGRHVACLWDDPDRIVDCQPGRAGPGVPPGPFPGPGPVPPGHPPTAPGPSGASRSPTAEEAP